ncbi:Lsr2 family protein [Dactylosporangium sp. AC04546]|uniref:histone-like nucleoid-structuring protein Lsr2 n=1 Tax=Dactylosporangium sp. AC04546 TaxID=2862460 RepID=UPI001EDFABB1|nr:Lsr2 family protein [Dactylosporangium sp. AC04546]WVK85519.1 Lsr2 family protein [Dactylosporangium sp. AC04546]
MVRRVIHTLVDDLDGERADESLGFEVDGVRYEIDLSAANAQRLRDALAPFVGAARRVGRGPVAGGGRGRTYRPERDSRRVSRARNQAIREWGQSLGLEVSARGRLSRELVARYHASAAAD